MHRRAMMCLVTLSAAFFADSGLRASAQSDVKPAATSPTKAEGPVPELEREKLEFEREKVRIEWWKMGATVGTILIPLLIAVFTIRSQIQSSLQLKDAEAKSAFEIKAAELVLGGYSPHAARGRAKVLESLFRHRLPPNFAESFDIADFPGSRLHEMKLELLRALAQQPDRREEILRTWMQVFPQEDWIKNIK